MKKLSLISILSIVSFFSLSAQAIQNATLVGDDGSTQIFYRIIGFYDAVDAAQDGNTYLSAGYFDGNVEVSRSIKIIGAGGFNDAKNTVLDGLAIKRDGDSYTEYLSVEGLTVRD